MAPSGLFCEASVGNVVSWATMNNSTDKAVEKIFMTESFLGSCPRSYWKLKPPLFSGHFRLVMILGPAWHPGLMTS